MPKKFNDHKLLMDYIHERLAVGKFPTNGQLMQRFNISAGTVAGLIHRAQKRGELPMRKDPIPVTLDMATGCRYPVGQAEGPLASHLFCDAPRRGDMPSSPYCPEHHALCYSGTHYNKRFAKSALNPDLPVRKWG